MHDLFTLIVAAMIPIASMNIGNVADVDIPVFAVSTSDSALTLNISLTPSPLPTNTPIPTKIPTKIPTRIPPTKTPTPTTVRISSGEIDAFFTKYANQERVDPSLLRKIAVCESGYNSMAVNGPYGGMFQFSESSWKTIRSRMSLDPSPGLRFHPEEAIKTAAFHLARNGHSSWANCVK